MRLAEIPDGIEVYTTLEEIDPEGTTEVVLVRHIQTQSNGPATLTKSILKTQRDYILVALIMGLMGAFFWAIRGTSGFGGSSGGALAGLGWATLWLAFSRMGGDGDRRPYGNGRAFAAITFGIAFGGLTGYGVYTAWVNGLYQMNREVTREIAPWTGYAMLFLCGIHWGGVTGAFLSWVAPSKPIGLVGWCLRIAAGFGGAALAVQAVGWFPDYFLPFYSEGYYQNEDYGISIRAMRSAPNVMQHVGFFLGFLVVEIARRDWRAVCVMLIMSLGFAIPFAVGGYWHTVHTISDLGLDWWKNWEMTIGLGGGLAFGLVFYLFNRPAAEVPRATTRPERIFGIGVTMWLAVGIVILGAYEGFIRTHQLEESLEATRTSAFWGYITIASLLGLFWIYRTLTLDSERIALAGPVSMAALTTVIGIIITAGYVTSLPAEMRLTNYVLVALYTSYITMSGLLLFLLLRHRSGPSRP